MSKPIPKINVPHVIFLYARYAMAGVNYITRTSMSLSSFEFPHKFNQQSVVAKIVVVNKISHLASAHTSAGKENQQSNNRPDKSSNNANNLTDILYPSLKDFLVCRCLAHCRRAAGRAAIEVRYIYVRQLFRCNPFFREMEGSKVNGEESVGGIPDV